ncbi:MAG: GAF domain-containing protein [Xenococcaceae cyanobacterium MO_234.B1]|nr:GAF domain-containing protein [Xenococcaceae cyanobacterium MO_234.B1]
MPKLMREQSSNNQNLILSKICELTNFPYGEIWLPKAENNLLELSSNYHVVFGNHQDDLELFHQCSQDFILSKGEGLPGRVWLNQEPEWILNVSAESEGYFLRNKIAGVCGVKTGFAIPVILEEKVLMILAFFTCDVRAYSSECIALARYSAIELSNPKAYS